MNLVSVIMSIYNQSQLTFDAQPTTVFNLSRVPNEESGYVYFIQPSTDNVHTFSYHESISKVRMILFHRDDTCTGQLEFQVYDTLTHQLIPGTSEQCTLNGTPIHTMEYTFDTLVAPRTSVYFALKTSNDFSTKTITIDWINLVIFQ